MNRRSDQRAMARESIAIGFAGFGWSDDDLLALHPKCPRRDPRQVSGAEAVVSKDYERFGAVAVSWTRPGVAISQSGQSRDRADGDSGSFIRATAC